MKQFELPAHKLKVMIVDDYKLFRDGVRATLQNIEFVSEIYEAESGTDCLQLLKKKRPDIIFMDISMKHGNGFETTQRISNEYPEIGVIALSMHEDETNIKGMLDAGALGYLFKNTDEKELHDSILSVYNRRFYFTQQCSDLFIQKLKKHKPRQTREVDDIILSDRETEILILICNELTTKQISELILLAEKTVEGHRTNLLKKLNVINSVGLVRFAMRNGIFTEPEKDK